METGRGFYVEKGTVRQDTDEKAGEVHAENETADLRKRVNLWYDKEHGMYIHLGMGVVVREEDVVGIFDMENTTVSLAQRAIF